MKLCQGLGTIDENNLKGIRLYLRQAFLRLLLILFTDTKSWGKPTIEDGKPHNIQPECNVGGRMRSVCTEEN